MSNKKPLKTTESSENLMIDSEQFNKNVEMLTSINEVKTKLLKDAESKMQEFNELKVTFGTKTDLQKVLVYLYQYANWESKDIVLLENTYNNINILYKNAKDEKENIMVNYIDVDCLFKHLEKEKSNDDIRTKGLKGATYPIFKYDNNGKVMLDENNKPLLETTFSIAYLKMLVARANDETNVLRLEFQSISDQIKMCDTYLQQVSIGQMPQLTLEEALKEIQEKYKDLIEQENGRK